jgi:SAM-dependent methyltransferase
MTHETRVERFYSHGLENYGTFHDNYLNFGLWSDGEGSFVRASEALLTRVGTKIGLSKDSILLDVGCGMGTQDRFLMQRFGCQAIEAVDLTAKHIAIARAKNGLPNVSYHVGNACQLPFPDHSFTHAVSIEGIVHFNTRETFFREARRLLRPAGRLGVSDFILARAPRNRMERLLLKAGASAWHVPAENVSTVAAYARSLERSGFVDAEIDVVSDQVIPGYFAEQSRPEIRRELYTIRGQVFGRLGVGLDRLIYGLYRIGLIGYVIASARKGPS